MIAPKRYALKDYAIEFRVYQVDINGIVVAWNDRQGFDGLRAFCRSYQRQTWKDELLQTIRWQPVYVVGVLGYTKAATTEKKETFAHCLPDE